MSPLPSQVNCAHCEVKYSVVRIGAPTAMEYGELTGLSCGGPLPAREGAFLMKYFLVDPQNDGSAARGRWKAGAKANLQSNPTVYL